MALPSSPSLPLYQWSACQLADAIATGQIRSVDAVNACFEQIDRLDDSLHAYITLDREKAIAAAEAADTEVQQGKILDALHGVPIAIKDLTATKNLRTTYGSRLFQNHIPSHDDLCVARLRSAGAIILGKTNTPEFGMGAHCMNDLCGPTATPYDVSRSSGGSSGGSAVAVATGMAYLAHGTDMGGSVRTPASFCNIVGLRPAAGRIPRFPKPLPWDTLVTDGILARRVDDAALMLSAMAFYDPRDPASIAAPSWPLPEFSEEMCDRLSGQIRLGFSAGLGIAVIDSGVQRVFEGAIDRLTPLCKQVTPTHPDCQGSQAIFETLRAGIVYKLHGHLLGKHSDHISSTVRWNIEQGKDLTADAYLQAEIDRGRLYQRFIEFFKTHDILATVAASVPPFAHDHGEILAINNTPLSNIIDYLAITYIITLTGLPAISIPCGWTASGLPVGMQLIGKPQREDDLLQFAYLLQERLGFCHTWNK
jgi:amidase